MDLEENPTERTGRILVEMNGVSLRRGESPTLEGINWAISEGQHWGILGASGSGKSLLIDALTRRVPLSGGTIRYFFDSRTLPMLFPAAGDISTFSSEDCRRFLAARLGYLQLFGRRRGSGESIWDIKRQIGSVSPELQLCYPPELTALDVVCSGLFDSIGLYRSRSTKQEARATAWLERLATPGVAGRMFWSLSAAEQRLVLLARALIKEPRLLVLDEPCLGLDTFHVARFLRQLERLCQNRPTTVLYVTHRLDELPSTTSHVLKLERGRIESAGPVSALRSEMR